MSHHEKMREDFGWWHLAQPKNFYTSDASLRMGLQHHCRRDRPVAVHEERLVAFGGISATEVHEAVEQSGSHQCLPQLLAGKPDELPRPEQVQLHPSHHRIGRHLQEAGAMELFRSPSNNVVGMGFLYLLALNGEAGHACPFACTAGLIKALEAIGSPDQRSAHVEKLVDRDYDKAFTAAQYLTESHGGSDVGANRCRALPDSCTPGGWTIHGEKWFCSNVTADLAVLTARPPEALPGTRGLGLFLLPRVRKDGSANAIRVLRLKDKLGTRSLATAEIALEGAYAEALGPIQDGFRNMMTHVINTSRLCNCAFSAAAAKRASVTARLYARRRRAFGRTLDSLPLVKHMLATMDGNAAASLSATLALARRLDDLEAASIAPADEVWAYRCLLSLVKYRAAVLARETVLLAIECLGGNGTTETFSVLPRLLRDSIVYETWEGPSNVLVAQLFRDLQRGSGGAALIRTIEDAVRGGPGDALGDLADRVRSTLGALKLRIGSVLQEDGDHPGWEFRGLMDCLGDAFMTACLCSEARAGSSATSSSNIADAARSFWNSSPRVGHA